MKPVYMCLLVIWIGSVFVNGREGPPLIVAHPDPQIIFTPSQTSIKLQCSAEGSYPMQFFWYHDFTMIHETVHKTISATGVYDATYEIVDPSKADQGEYICEVINNFGIAQSRITEVIQAVLEHSETAEEVIHEYVYLSEAYTLSCDIPFSIPYPVISWIRTNNVSMQTYDVSYNERITMDHEGNLHFLYIDTSDEGSYRCEITNPLLQQSTFGRTLSLTLSDSSPHKNVDPILMWYSDLYIFALPGSSFSMTCIFGGRPVPSITWVKISDYGENITLHDNIHDYGREIVFNNVDFSDEASYECYPNGDHYNSVYFHVFVESAPEWILQPDPVEAYPGQEVMFTCSATGIPEPDIHWYIDTANISDVSIDKRPFHQETTHTEGETTSTLYFKAEISFAIECVCENYHGIISFASYLHVTPDFITDTTQTSTEITSFEITSLQTQETTTAHPTTTAKTSSTSQQTSTTTQAVPLRSSKLPVIGGAVGGAVAAFIVVIVVIYCICSKRRIPAENGPKPNSQTAYRNSGFTDVEKQNSITAKEGTYTGLSDQKQEENVYEELKVNDMKADIENRGDKEEAEYSYISDKAIIEIQRQSGKPIPSVSKPKAKSDNSGPKLQISSPSAVYDAQIPKHSKHDKKKKQSHFPSGKYSAIGNPMYRGQSIQPPGDMKKPELPARYEEPHKYFEVQPDNTHM